MARTDVTPVALGRGVATNSGAGTTIDATLVTNGVRILAGGKIDRLLIRITNTHGADHDVTIKNAPQQSGYPDGGGYAFMAGAGDLAVTVPATSGDVLIAGLEVARFIVPGGYLYLDLAENHAGTLYVYELPRLA